MRIWITVILLFLISLAQAGAVEIKEVKTPLGIKALLVEDYTLPIVALAFSFKGGTTQDPSGKDGTLRLMTALMDEGAGDLDNLAFQARAEEIGLEFGFSASRDRFSGGGRMLRSEKETSFELLRLAINEPRFDEDAIERMREAIRTGIVNRKTDPSSAARKALREAIFEGHPYSRSVSGTEETIASITRNDIIAMNRKILARDTLTVGVVGAISETELAEALDQIFGSLPEQSGIEEINEVLPKLGEEVSIEMQVPNSSISIVYPAIKRNHPDFFAAHLMNHILGGGTFSSRLYTEVREKRGLAYGVSSGLSTFDRTAFFYAGTSTRADNTYEAIRVIKEEIDRIKEMGITEKELEDAKRFVIGSYAINNLDTSSKIANVLVALQVQNLGINYIDEREKLIASVTVEDANRIAREMFSGNSTIVVVGPATQ